MHAVEEMDRRQVAERRHVLTTRQWLRRFGRMSKAAASKTMSTVAGLRAMPNVMRRALAGEVPAESVRQLAAARRAHPEAFAHHEEVFADAASSLEPTEMRRAIDAWRQQVGHAGVMDEIEHRRARRRASLHQTIDGMWHHDGLYDPETGQVVSTALRGIADRGTIDPDDGRTHGQRMADAMADVCRFWLDHNDSVTTSAGEKPHITVTVDYDALVSNGIEDRQLSELDGVPIEPETVRRLACDAAIVRIVVDGEGQPLDVGRRVRTVTPAIRRALELRDGGCAWDGCDAPVGWCDAHYLVHWAAGGMTSVENMMLLCRRHHTAVHEGRRPRSGLPGRAPPDS